MKAILAGVVMLGAALALPRRRSGLGDFGSSDHDHYAEAHRLADRAEEILMEFGAVNVSSDTFCKEVHSILGHVRDDLAMAYAHYGSIENLTLVANPSGLINKINSIRIDGERHIDKFSDWCLTEKATSAVPSSRQRSDRERDMDTIFGPSPFKPWKPGERL